MYKNILLAIEHTDSWLYWHFRCWKNEVFFFTRPTTSDSPSPRPKSSDFCRLPPQYRTSFRNDHKTHCKQFTWKCILIISLCGSGLMSGEPERKKKHFGNDIITYNDVLFRNKKNAVKYFTKIWWHYAMRTA